MFEPYLERLAGFPGVLLAVIGLFYIFAGLVLARQVMLDRVLTRAIEMISFEKPSRLERFETAWMTSGAILVFASGAALLVLSGIAVWLFAAALLQQVIYLTWLAPRYFDRDEEPDPAGRRQSINAAFIFGACALGVAAAGLSGKLLPLTGDGMPSLVAAGSMLAIYVVWIAIRSRMPAGNGGLGAGLEPVEPDEALMDMARIRALSLSPEHWAWPVHIEFFEDDAEYNSPIRLGLSGKLADELTAWQDEFDAAFEEVDEEPVAIWAEGQQARHVERAAELADAMRAELRAAGAAHVQVRYRDVSGELVTLED